MLDPHPERLAAARRFGAAHTIRATRGPDDVAAAREHRPELVIEAVGRPEAWELAVQMAEPGGTVNLFGGCARDSTFTVPTARVHYEEVTLLGTYHHAPRYLARALDVLAANEHPWAELYGAEITLERAAGGARRASPRQAQCANGAVTRVGQQRVPLLVVSGAGRSRSPSTVHRNPNGSSPALTHRCGAHGRDRTRSNGRSSCTSPPTSACPRPRTQTTACSCACFSSDENPPGATSK